MSKKRIQTGEGKGSFLHVPESKRTAVKLSTPEHTRAVARYLNEDTIAAQPEGKVVRTRRVVGTNSSKTNKE